jgi:UDP-glucose 4-epimerase
MRWLVTGGCGFIGRNLVRALLQEPQSRVRVVDNLSWGTREELAALAPLVELDRGRRSPYDERLALMVGDIRDEALAREVVVGADVIVHLAANTGVAPSVSDPRYDCTTNVLGTLNYLEACRHVGVKRFVFASSGAPIGDCTPPLHEELPTHPTSPYGASKLAGEAYCSAYRHSFGVDTVALRFGNCYGPLSSHKNSVVAKFIRDALGGAPWDIYGDGRQTRDFIYVDDVVAAVRRASAVDDIGGEVFQIATSSETTVGELAEQLAAELKKHGIAAPAIRREPERIGDVKRNYSDTRKALAKLGWKAAVPLSEGLARTVEWFLQTAGRKLTGRSVDG